MNFEISLFMKLLERRKIIFSCCLVSLLFGIVFNVLSTKVWRVEAVLGKPAATVVSQYNPFGLKLLQSRAEELVMRSASAVPFALQQNERNAADLLAFFEGELKSPLRLIDFLQTRSDYASELFQDHDISSFDENLPQRAYAFMSKAFEVVWDSKQKDFLIVRLTFTGNFQGDRFLNSYIEYLNTAIWAERNSELLADSARIRAIAREVSNRLLDREKEVLLDRISTYREGIHYANAFGMDEASCEEVQCLDILNLSSPTSPQLALLGTKVLRLKISNYEERLSALSTGSDQTIKYFDLAINELGLDRNDNISPVKVVVPASPPAKPISPSPLKIFFVFGAAGLLIGIGTVVMAEFQKNLKKALAEDAGT